MSDESYIDFRTGQSLWGTGESCDVRCCSRCEFRRMAQMRQPTGDFAKALALLSQKLAGTPYHCQPIRYVRSRLHAA